MVMSMLIVSPSVTWGRLRVCVALARSERHVWFSFAVVVTRRERGSELAQLTALFTSALIFASSVAVNSSARKRSATWRLRRGSPRR